MDKNTLTPENIKFAMDRLKELSDRKMKIDEPFYCERCIDRLQEMRVNGVYLCSFCVCEIYK